MHAALLLFALVVSGSYAISPSGKWFDKFVIVILENEDVSAVLNNTYFRSMASSGILQTNYHAVTHPSQPNCKKNALLHFRLLHASSTLPTNCLLVIAFLRGDWAMVAGADNFPGQIYVGGQTTQATLTISNGDESYDIYNTSTIVDLLENVGLDFKIYSENYPTSGSCYLGGSFGNETTVDVSHFRHNGTNPVNRAYVRKHNPFISFKTFTDSKKRCEALKDFNDMNSDITNGNLTAFSFVVPNEAHDGHDTTISYSGTWLKQFIQNITSSSDYKQSRILIHVVYDEGVGKGAKTSDNEVFSILFGSALSSNVIGVNDITHYTHYSNLATVEANWGLGNLGKHDSNAPVFELSGTSALTSAGTSSRRSRCTLVDPAVFLIMASRWLMRVA